MAPIPPFPLSHHSSSSSSLHNPFFGMLALYIKFFRKREEKRRKKRWSEDVDKRMSVISVDWRSMSANLGAEAAIRASMVWTASASNADVPGIDTTPGCDMDMEDSNAGGLMMSPTRRTGALDFSAEDICGARMNGMEDQIENEPRPSLDAVMPALTIMRTVNDSQEADLLLELERSEQQLRSGGTIASLHVVETSVPAVPPPPAKSPIMDAMPMQPLSAADASVMSPDEMLRAYAERRRTAGSNMTSPPGTSAPGGGGIAFPVPVANAGLIATSVSTTMRTLYSPAGSTFVESSSVNARAAAAAAPDTTTNPFRKSMARRDSPIW